MSIRHTLSLAVLDDPGRQNSLARFDLRHLPPEGVMSRDERAVHAAPHVGPGRLATLDPNCDHPVAAGGRGLAGALLMVAAVDRRIVKREPVTWVVLGARAGFVRCLGCEADEPLGLDQVFTDPDAIARVLAKHRSCKSEGSQ